MWIIEKHYKVLIFLPLLVLLLALVQIGFQYQQTGAPLQKGISLTGGYSLAVAQAPLMDVEDIQIALQEQFDQQILVRGVQERGQLAGIIVESDATTFEQTSALREAVVALYGDTLSTEFISEETTGANLGNTFYQDMIKALIIAFIVMGIVVFILFRTIIPSIAVILAAFADIVVTIAIANMLGVQFSTGGLAALLMLIGYSVDTDIMLTNRMLKQHRMPIKERLTGAFQTGMLMTGTTLVAVLIALLVSDSAVISQIMLIIFIGLCVDAFFTWLANAGLLLWYVKRGKHHER
ncbi:MAG: preprotein translocase subunit SecF [Candidatus Woesearchaeota archaeon]